jgi:FlaA1/EpsC-like NDP-sugar epimerase
MCAVAGIRVSVRLIRESQSKGRSRGSADVRKRVLVVGAGDAGAIVTREMQRNAQLGMQPVAFLDDDAVKVGKRIYGVPVVDSLSNLPDVVQGLRVDQVIIAMPKAGGNVVRAVIEQCQRAGVGSLTMPGVFELIGGHASVSRLRQVDITDLLRRNPVTTNGDVGRYVEGRTVVVTGAGGSIGFELCRQIADSGPRRLLLLGHGENSIFDAQAQLRDSFPDIAVEPVIADIRDRGRMFRVFDRARPEIVFHAAAHKHVPLMEDNPEEAISNNVVGTQNVIDAAIRIEADRFVLISSDKAVSPSSLMGASKRVAEALVRDAARRAGRRFVVVRFGNVLGSRGSVVPTFKKQIENGGPVYVTHPEMKRFFMTIPEAVHLVLQAGGMGKGGELFVLKMGAPLTIVQLAEDLIRLSGLSAEEVPIVFTGLRPGEKLEECLWETGAVTEVTEHPDILNVLEPHAYSHSRSADLVTILASAAANGDRVTITRALRELIPTFSQPEQPFLSQKAGRGSSRGVV